VAAGVLLFVYGFSAIGENFRAHQTAPVIQVQVRTGDTLWALAQRYGNPDEYILKRVQRLAALNGIGDGVRLHSGMTLEVPVENQAERTRLMSASAR
jgi:nucleoid-associated protein YgaU